MKTIAYPHYGCERPGTNNYERGGFSFGGYLGLGQGDDQVTSTAPAITADTREDYVKALREEAAAMIAAGTGAAVTGGGIAAATSYSAANALIMQADAIEKGAADPPPGAITAASAPSWWAGLSGTHKLVVGGGALLGVGMLMGWFRL
jgi:hypothetical protein